MGINSTILWSAAFTLILATLIGGKAIGNGNGRPFTVNFCSANSGDALGLVTLETIQPSAWPKDKFCQALTDGASFNGNYNLSLQLFNDQAFSLRRKRRWSFKIKDLSKVITALRVKPGHPGIAFNVKDSINYDFVYFRPHSANTCYQTGYIQNSVMHLTQSAKCPHGPPKTQTWFKVTLEVTGRKTRVFLDGSHAVTFSHHHDNVARGGGIVANGYKNRVFFRGYKTTPLGNSGSQTKVATCVAHRESPAYNTLDATSGTWPASGFCRVLIGSGVAGTKYRLSVDLYNAQGWRGINSGHPGVMYNAQDIDNFDFVYFRPHSSGQCFQTGYVRNGQLKWDGAVSSRCSNGVPIGGRWFNVEVHVNGASAAIYKDGVLVHTARPKFQPRGKGGVIVANGYKNVVRYKYFSISAL